MAVEVTIKESFDHLQRETTSHEDIINAEFSVIKEHKNQGVSPRSHG